MQVLLMLLTFLTATKLIEAELPLKQSEAVSQIGLSNCLGQLHIQNANLTKVLECLQRSDNRTAFMEDTFWKLDLLDRRLGRLEATQQTEVCTPSPYENIDDVLNIEGSVASYNCQEKQHVMQAIRRKLYQVQLANGNESPLFKWAFAILRTGGESGFKRLYFNASTLTTMQKNEYQQITCLIVEAIKRYDETVARPKDGP